MAKLDKEQKEQVAKQIEDLKAKEKKIVNKFRHAQKQVKSAEDYYKPFMRETPSKAVDFFEMMKDDKKHAGVEVDATILECSPNNQKYRVRKIYSAAEMKSAIEQSEQNATRYVSLREGAIRKRFEKHFSREDSFTSDDTIQSSTASLPEKFEYTPLLSTPFFKQMYWYDFLLMHSKAFYFKNYSTVGKAIIDITRNFVLGTGYSATIDDDKQKQAWEDFEKRNEIQKKIRVWCDELTYSGEIMLEKDFTASGLMIKSIDVSTIWEVVTDPESINDIKYFHQQYNTQYQLYGTKDAPVSKYIIRQIPPDRVPVWEKINVTSWEKRGRSDLLPALIYMKYFEEYIEVRLLRAKLETSMFWDVTISGGPSEIAEYLANSESIIDVPPGSENVHNEAIKREPLTPAFTQVSNDTIVKEILGAIAMSVNIPATYLSSIEASTGTRAGALVATEPVAKKMQERRLVIEGILHKLFALAMIDAGINPDEAKCEFNFPELIVEDRSKKIADVMTSEQTGYISHETAATIIAKELGITTYDYDDEQEKILEEKKASMAASSMLMPNPNNPNGQAGSDLTGDKSKPQTQGDRAFDRSQVRQDSKQL